MQLVLLYPFNEETEYDGNEKTQKWHRSAHDEKINAGIKAVKFIDYLYATIK